MLQQAVWNIKYRVAEDAISSDQIEFQGFFIGLSSKDF
jgi:hypothetical protein